MAKSKSFGSYRPVGIPSMEMTIHGETFKVRGAMSGIQLLNMIKAMDGSSELDSADTMVDFIRRSILTEDRDRAMDFLENSEPPVPLTVLTEIITWLIEEYTAKPTGPSLPSSDGSTTTGSTSTESASSTESTSLPTASTDVPSLPSSPPLSIAE